MKKASHNYLREARLKLLRLVAPKKLSTSKERDALRGVTADVTYREGHSERLKVWLLDRSQYPELRKRREEGDEFAEVELYCNRPAGWARNLTIASHDYLMLLGQKLNMEFYLQWLREKR
ncbi:MAG TPA: hypothetical protein VN673_12810 [Clostridia bacterium]|nr:hypothetical protein [Clostridia bacterium]